MDARLRAFLLVTAALALAQRAPAAVGGPDAAGYVWADSDEPGVNTSIPAFSGVNLRAAPYNFQGDDKVTDVPVPLPATSFPTGFPFYGASYTRFWLSSNGWLAFVDPAGDSHPTTADIPDGAGAPPNAIVPFFWRDLTLEYAAPLASGGENTAKDGYTFLIRFSPKTDTAKIAQIFVTLFQTGAIKVVYQGDVAVMADSSTAIGIENAAGTIGLPYMLDGLALNGAKLRDAYAVVFHPPGKLDCVNNVSPIACGSPVSSNNSTGPGQVNKYSCAPGSYLGNEKVFDLDLATTSNLVVTLTNTDGLNRHVFLHQAVCHEQAGCITGGSTSLTAKFVPPGQYYLVVDGAGPSDNGDFTLDVACEDATTALPCNTALAGESVSGPGFLSSWSCAPGLAGPEKVYELTVAGPATLRATLANKSDPSLELLLSDATGFSFSKPACQQSDPDAVTLFSADGPYFVTVDGPAGASGSYDIEVACERRLVCPVPASVIDVLNPVPVVGDTTGKPATVDVYSCAASIFGPPGPTPGYTGPEDVYEFTISSAALVYFEFAPADPDLRLLVLSDCYEGSCVAEGGCAEALEPGTYRLVVDGLGGAAGSYSITPHAFAPVSVQRWYDCPELPAASQDEDTIHLPAWHFDSGNFCGTGCDFSLFAVMECPGDLHIPFWDVETGQVRVFDVLGEQLLDLTAANDSSSCPYADGPAKDVEWEDSTCSAIPCPAGSCGGGSDCRTDQVVMDVRFQGSAKGCRVYQLELSRWGGYDWTVWANCTGLASPKFEIYRDVCAALIGAEDAACGLRPLPLLRAHVTQLAPPVPPLAGFLPLDLATDAYVVPFASGETDPEATILGDTGKPLVFYGVDAARVLHLTKTGDAKVRIEF